MSVPAPDDPVPLAIEPVVPVDVTYTEGERELWVGRGSYLIEGRRFECDARLTRHWRPEPALVMTTEADEPGVGDAFPDGLSDVTFDGLDAEGLVQVGGSFHGAHRERRFELVSAVLGHPRPVKVAQFAVPNFPRFLGQAVTAGGSTYAARIDMEASGWCIRFEGLGGASQSYEALQQAGFGVTHLGTTAKQDGGLISPEDIERAMTIIGWWLSLFRGAYTTPCWWAGLADDGQMMWTRHVDWNVDAWKGEWGLFPSGWFHPEHPDVLGELAGSLARAFDLMADDEWEDALMMALHLYIVANTGRNASDVIIAQAGLERLAHATIVLSGKLSGPGFERLTAADQIQLAAGILGVSVQVPAELKHLASWAKAENVHTSAEVVTRLRNRVAHPPRRKLTLTEREQESRLRSDARELSLSLLERGLLATLNYEGHIRDRLAGFMHRSLKSAEFGLTEVKATAAEEDL